MDITGMKTERLEKRRPSLVSVLNQGSKDPGGGVKDYSDSIPFEVLLFLKGHFSSLYPSAAVQRCCVRRTVSPTALVGYKPSEDVEHLGKSHVRWFTPISAQLPL